MGKGARLRMQRTQEREQASAVLKVGVITYPRTSSGTPDLRRDTAIVRAALLYADEIELISPGAAMLGSAANLAEGGVDSLIDLFASLDDETLGTLGATPLPANWRDILPLALGAAKLDPATTSAIEAEDPKAGAALAKLRDGFSNVERSSGDFRNAIEQMLERSGGADLLPAFDAGVLRLSSSGLEGADDADDIISGYMALIRKMLVDPSLRLLFDDEAGTLVRELVDSGGATPHQLTLKHAGEAAVGSGLIARLPAFPDAPTDELLDLRRDLSPSLTRYRRSVSRLAGQVASPSYEPSIRAEIDDLWISEVEPALLEIKEQLGEHGFVRELAKAATQDVKAVLAGASVYIGLTAGTAVGDVAASAVSVGSAAVAAAARAAVSSRAEKRGTKAHELFYLYDVNRQLA